MDRAAHGQNTIKATEKPSGVSLLGVSIDDTKLGVPPGHTQVTCHIAWSTLQPSERHTMKASPERERVTSASVVGALALANKMHNSSATGPKAPEHSTENRSCSN